MGRNSIFLTGFKNRYSMYYMYVCNVIVSPFAALHSYVHFSPWAHEKEQNRDTNSNCKGGHLCSGSNILWKMTAVMYEECVGH